MTESLSGRAFSLAVATTILAGCPHRQPQQPPSSSETQAAADRRWKPLVHSVPVQSASAQEQPQEQQGQHELDQALAALREVDLFFAFNDETLTDAARGKLDAVADVLSKHRALHVRIDGNCDERGTEEYNMSLGQRRAERAKQYLIQLGASADQISTVSYGQEKPRATGHDEKSWQENRRDDIAPVKSQTNQ